MENIQSECQLETCVFIKSLNCDSWFWQIGILNNKEYNGTMSASMLETTFTDFITDYWEMMDLKNLIRIIIEESGVCWHRFEFHLECIIAVMKVTPGCLLSESDRVLIQTVTPSLSPVLKPYPEYIISLFILTLNMLKTLFQYCIYMFVKK